MIVDGSVKKRVSLGFSPPQYEHIMGVREIMPILKSYICSTAASDDQIFNILVYPYNTPSSMGYRHNNF